MSKEELGRDGDYVVIDAVLVIGEGRVGGTTVGVSEREHSRVTGGKVTSQTPAGMEGTHTSFIGLLYRPGVWVLSRNSQE
ncbi:hypothetical protein Pmani_039602 [Petrolisthes manimaculis]|uniref:Uncharacterized protein n=1 Tax=Petrolisthes manimaculis TaxID=1843537 RepID=A0AAE1NCE4_9EUCA|nr:hypothetical protein Pmani_039602 [Petrolisthes manimaculis]